MYKSYKEIARERTSIIKRKIKESIKLNKTSVAQVAKHLRTHRNFINQSSGFTVNKLYEIADAIGCKIYELLPDNKEEDKEI